MNYKLYTQFLMNEADAGDTGAGGGEATTTETTETASTETTATEGGTAFDEVKTEATATPEWAKEYGVDPSYNDFLAKHGDLNSVLKEAVNAQSLIGKKGLILPDENSTPEQIAEFNKALGVPDKVDGYDFGLGEDASEMDKGLASEIAQIALESNATPAQAKAAFEVEKAKITERIEARETARVECLAQLNKEHGAESSKVLEAAKAVAEQGGYFDALAQSDLGNNPKFISDMAKLAKSMGIEASAPTNNEIGNTGTNNADSNRLIEIRNNPKYGTDTIEGRALHAELQGIYDRKVK